MKKLLVVTAAALLSSALTNAQIGRTFDWYTAAGDNQRTGWEKSDTKFTKADVKDFSLVLQMKLAGKGKDSSYLMPPVVLGTLIGYRGFKELGFIANGAGDVWAIDVDLDTVYWQRHIDNLPKPKKASAACPGGIVSQPTMEPGATFGARRKKGAKAPSRDDFFKKIFAPRALFLLATDGKLYQLDTSTGKDMKPPVEVMPAGADVSNLNAGDDVIYATTSDSCGDAPNAVWQVNLSGDAPKVASYPSPAPEGFVGRNGVLVGSEDDVYAQTTNTLQVLSPTDLKPQQTYSGALGKVSPVAFDYKDRDVLVTVGKDGGLYLLDTKSLTTPLSQTPPVTAGDDSEVVGLATWQTMEGTRWILAAVKGGSVDAPTAKNGAIVAYQLTDDDGKPGLKHIWTSEDISVPEPPVIANGVVFALSAGEMKHKGKLTGHATLYALDGDTGKVIYSTRDQVTAPANLSGVTMANGRVYFTTTDSTLWAFGYHLEH